MVGVYLAAEVAVAHLPPPMFDSELQHSVLQDPAHPLEAASNNAVVLHALSP